MACWALLFAPLVACSIPAMTPGEPAKLVGAWLMEDGATLYPDGCESSAPIRYYKDGEYALFAESGTWELRGNLLTEVATDADRIHPDADGTMLGKANVSELTFVDDNRFLKKFSDGEVRVFRRCPMHESS